MNDRNKTPLTHRVTAVAVACLDSLGCKPIETEVPIAGGWIADVASYWYPSPTTAKRFHLDKIDCPTRLAGEGGDNLDVRLGFWGGGPFTIAVEVKTTPGDFRSDPKWSRPPPAHICILAFPNGVVERVPEGWCGLETNQDGDKVLKWHRGRTEIHPQHPGAVLEFVAQVGIRRDHRTRDQGLKDWAKAYRAEDAEKKRQYSAARLLEGVANWLQGRGVLSDRPLRDALSALRIKLPKYLDESIAYFEALRKREAAEAKED